MLIELWLSILIIPTQILRTANVRCNNALPGVTMFGINALFRRLLLSILTLLLCETLPS